MVQKLEIGTATLYLGDCREVLPTLGAFGSVVTDPPYPDYLVDEYRYSDELIACIEPLACRQFVFWSGRAPFPLSYTAVHIWNKNPSNHGAQYERVFERNGNGHQKVFTHYMVNSSVAAQMTRDVFVPHPSQKPISLMTTLCAEVRGLGVVVDPFMGSGTTGVACANLGLPFVGVEIEPKYFGIACERITAAHAQQRLFA